MRSVYERLDLDRAQARQAARETERRERDITRTRAELAGLRLELALIALRRAYARKYREDQPRVPAGQPGEGSSRTAATPEAVLPCGRSASWKSSGSA